MTTKTLRKQLIAAVAMLLAATIVLTGSTFAWLAKRSHAEAEEVTISAISDKPTLQISNAAAGTYATMTTLDPAANTASDLYLTIPLNLSGNLITYQGTRNDPATNTTPSAATSPATLLWGTAMSTDPTEVQAANIPWDVTASLNEYALVTHVYVRTAANTQGQHLRMIEPSQINTGTNSIANAVRILAVAADGKWMLYNKRTNAVTSCTEGYLLENICEEGVGAGYDDITVYVYFDGTDAISYTNAAADLSAVTSNLLFTCNLP